MRKLHVHFSCRRPLDDPSQLRWAPPSYGAEGGTGDKSEHVIFSS